MSTVSIKAAIDILPDVEDTNNGQLGFRVMTESYSIGAILTRKGEAKSKEYASLSIAAPEFGPEKLYGNFGKAAGSDDKDLYAVI